MSCEEPKCDNELYSCPLKFVVDHFYKMEQNHPNLYIMKSVKRLDPNKKFTSKTTPMYQKLSIPKELM